MLARPLTTGDDHGSLNDQPLGSRRELATALRTTANGVLRAVDAADAPYLPARQRSSPNEWAVLRREHIIGSSVRVARARNAAHSTYSVIGRITPVSRAGTSRDI